MLAGAIMICASYAQVVEKGEPVLVYYSPKTMINLEFHYTIETQEPGIYSEYAEDMLGLTDYVTETKTIYHLTNVQIGTATIADYTRPHKVKSEAGIPLLLHINEKGLLAGYNTPLVESPKAQKKHESSTKAGVKSRIVSMKSAPYLDDVLQAASPLAQANAVAKQILHIRETRMYLLSGEVEHSPADGKAMKEVLEELDKQEQALTELFTGKKTTRKESKFVRIDPEEEIPNMFFSEENGFTNRDNVDADSIVVKVALYKQEYFSPNTKKRGRKKKMPEVSQIVYNLPGNGDIEVVYNERTIAKRSVILAQLGIDVPLAKDVFAGPELPVIVFNEKTGNIISISK
jgi:uncharacterized protein YggU (UPF0235/DUF167 family)